MIKTTRDRKYDITFYFRDGNEEKIKDVDENTTLLIKDLLNTWSGESNASVHNEFHHIYMLYYIRSKFVQRA